MDHPKILILFTVYNEYPDAERRVGVLAPDRQFFQLLQEHLDATLTFFCTVPQAMKVGVNGVEFRYRELTTDHGTGFLEFISRDREIVEQRGETIDDLLSVCATDLLRPDVVVEATLEEAEQPAVIDFKEWHQALFDSGYFEGSIDEFWEALKAQGANLRGERIVIGMPEFSNKGDKLEKLPYFTFRARDKHSDSECDWISMRFPMQQFIQGIGDAVLSRLG